MKKDQDLLYKELQDLVQAHQSQLESLKALDLSQLQSRPNPEAWNALECLEHLNRYGDFYLPECKRVLASAKKAKANPQFKSSWLGEYFAQSMWPKANFKSMQTFKVMNPSGDKVELAVMDKFSQQLQDWQQFLDGARLYDWRRTKTNISISSLIKLRLGDTLRVVFYHNERHLRQAFKAAGLS